MEFSIKDIVNDLFIRRIQGGFREFERTRIYPDKIIFTSWQLGKSWKQKVKSENQSGSVKSDGKVIFNYRLIDDQCEIQIVKDASFEAEWIKKEISITMCD